AREKPDVKPAIVRQMRLRPPTVRTAPSRAHLITASFAVVSVAAGLWLAPPWAAERGDGFVACQAPTATAPYFTLEFEWIDEVRGRKVPIRLYLPNVVTGSPLPLVVFSHGIGGSRRGYSALRSRRSAHGRTTRH